jgi:asparagine synthase (glutamine-hydrolysing)
MDAQMPGLIGVFPGPNEAAAPYLRMWGPWRPGELRVVTASGGQLVVVGQCLADERNLRADFRQALATDRLDLVTRWPGSYLAVVVRADDLTAYTDLAGQYPLHYRSVGGRTVLGTHAEATARAAGLRVEPDLVTLAAQVFCPSVPMLTRDRSVVAGVTRLGGGQALALTRGGGRATWTYETLAPDADVSFADAADALRDALDRAVRLRARSTRQLTADFSGGLDSTSVAFLAVRHRTSLPVFTYHQPDVPADDLAHAVRYASLDSRLRPHIVQGTDETLPYQGLDRIVVGSLPDPGAVVRAKSRALLRQIAATGTGVHLGGEGADALLVAPPGYLADLARRGSQRRLRQECRELARTRRVSPAKVLARANQLSMTSANQALHLLADRLERPVDRCVEWLDAIAWWPQPGAESCWLTPWMRRELAELVRGAATGPDAAEGLGVADHAAVGELRTAGAVQRQLDEQGRELDVWPQAPFLDNDVIRACLQLQACRRANPLVLKPLLGTALAGLVPEPVLARQTKGNYSAEDYRGARLAAGELRNRVARLRFVDLGVVDRAPVLRSLGKAIDGLPAPFPAFNRLIGADLWLHGVS